MDGKTLLPGEKLTHDSFDRKLIFLLILSVVLHLVLILFFPLLYSSPSSSKPLKPGKKPILVDLVEFPDSLSKEPASLSPNVYSATKGTEKPSRTSRVPTLQPAPASRKKTPLKSSEQRPNKKAGNKKPQPAVPRDAVPEVAIETPPSPKPRDLPSREELMPSFHNILAMVAPDRDFYGNSSLRQDGISDLPARVQFNQYLADLKRRVEQNWRVSRNLALRNSTTVLLLVVNSDGTLRSLNQVKSCGIPVHDFETIAAVRQSFPFRPPSKVLLDEQGLLPIRFSFHYIVSPSL